MDIIELRIKKCINRTAAVGICVCWRRTVRLTNAIINLFKNLMSRNESLEVSQSSNNSLSLKGWHNVFYGLILCDKLMRLQILLTTWQKNDFLNHEINFRA
ncbi:CLUMA_CG000732, isoform A [Clunio marinus]|uniref:CLUMA_CG000732, isoform A n=1 Tax=Clunio marinus TaxID=568069 RepID=A0A1J1HG01_9DIPT|nr:CLUMA_CG000732, isoform A [Clunio marinus]